MRPLEMRPVFRRAEQVGQSGSGELLELVEDGCRCASGFDLWLCRGLTKKSVDKERGQCRGGYGWCGEKSRAVVSVDE